MKHLAICILAALALTHSSARADPDWTGKSWADYYAEFAGCDPAKGYAPGDRCAPVAAAHAGLVAIDALCDQWGEGGECISTDEVEEVYRDCDASSPMAVLCWRGSGQCALSGGSAARSMLRFCGASGVDGWRRCCYIGVSAGDYSVYCVWSREGDSEVNDLPGKWPRPTW